MLVGARDRAFGAPRHCGTPRRGRIVCKQAPSRGGRTLATRRFTGATHARGLSVGARDRAFGAPRPFGVSRRERNVARSGSVARRAHFWAAPLHRREARVRDELARGKPSSVGACDRAFGAPRPCCALLRRAASPSDARARDKLARVRACISVGACDRAFGAPRPCSAWRGRVVAQSRSRTFAPRRFNGATHARAARDELASG